MRLSDTWQSNKSFVYRTEEDRRKNQGVASAVFQAQKIEPTGTMVNGIAHSFNNILRVIRGYTEMILFDIPEDYSLCDDFQQVVKSTMEAKELADKMLMFSRKEKPILKFIEI